MLLKVFRNQFFPLELLNLPAWLTEGNIITGAIPTRTWAPAVHLLHLHLRPQTN